MAAVGRRPEFARVNNARNSSRVVSRLRGTGGTANGISMTTSPADDDLIGVEISKLGEIPDAVIEKTAGDVDDGWDVISLMAPGVPRRRWPV